MTSSALTPAPSGPPAPVKKELAPHIPIALSTWGDLWKPPPQEKLPRSGSVETWREVIDTIVFVVVLVLILKSFVAECFVIPTGSMAETLLGYHKLVDCPSCGVRYAVNCSQEVENPEFGHRTDHGVCPNCLESVNFETQGRRKSEFSKSIPDPGPTTGDRVLVSKFFNDLLNIPYKRFDVVVFKYPGNSHPIDQGYGNPAFPNSGPQKEHTAMNYIKRLIGLPGDSIAIHGGDLYKMDGFVPPAGVTTPREVDRWQFENMFENMAQDDFQKGKFTILRKPPHVVLSESRLVYDHDHPPSDLTSLPRWIAAQGGIDTDGPSAFRAFHERTCWLRYQHLLRGNLDPTSGQPRKQLITDIMGYNDIRRDRAMGVGSNWVADLILESEIQAQSGTGTAIYELSRGPDRFQARFDFATGSVELVRVTGSEKKSLKKWDSGGPKGTAKAHIRFANVDRTLHVWVNNKLVSGDGVPYESPIDVAPDVVNDLEPASIGFENLKASVAHLKLSRDSYYTVRVHMPQDPDVSVRDWTAGPELPKGAYPEAWNDLRKLPVKTLFVQPGHYLCMGDNSSHSSDGRSWGLVPHRLMLGQAVAVYFPLSRMGKIR